jgi:hypothetical protein
MYKWGPLSSMDGTWSWEILPLSQVCLSTVLIQFAVWCVMSHVGNLTSSIQYGGGS